MAGRDTPSPELKRAAEFVAERFRKAGLKGGAKENSFFQITEIATTSLPTAGIALKAGGQDVRHYGLMGAGQKEFQFSGKVTEVDPATIKDRVSGPVAFEAGPVKRPSDQVQIARYASRLKRLGATAVLIRVADDHPLIKTAGRNGLPRIINPRERFSAPTLLVADFSPETEYEIRIPKIQHGKTSVRNVIGLIPGSHPQLHEEAIIFSAHLDHIGQQPGAPDPIFNGADDNATGVTAVLSLADAFAAMPKPPARTVIFMTFWGEERGLLGSKYYAQNPTWPLKQTVANINIEMIGRPEAGANGKCWMTGWHQSDLGTLMADASKAVGVEIFEHPRLSQFLYRASDNASFVDRGVIAHSFSAGSLHGDYHKPSDEWDRLQLKHMTKVIQGLFVGSLPLAEGQVTPRSTGARR